MKILHEDNHLIAIHKEAGLLTHSDHTGDVTATEQVKSFLKTKYNKPGNVFLNPVHRLDRPVSGLLLFAKTSKATARMADRFRKRNVDKLYVALTNFVPKQFEGELVHHLKKNKQKNIVSAVGKSKNKGKRAKLMYRMIGEMDGKYLLRIEPKTGRSHQIRVQLSEMGCPIVGDLKYNATEKTDGRSIGLHSYSLTFEHPVKREPITITCPLPENKLWREFRHLEELI